MKVKLFVIFSVATFTGFFMFLGNVDLSGVESVVLAKVATPTPPAGNTASNTNTAANTATPAAPAADDKSIPKHFTLANDSQSEYGEVAFNHEAHAFQNYSADGKSVMSCAECHHTDQPKSSLKPPLVTSERDITLTFDSWKTTTQKVNECRVCHFQDGNIPDGKEMPSAKYTVGRKSTTKDITNQLAYHINCNTCHDAAFKLRPELKKKPGFATTKDCATCHKTN